MQKALGENPKRKLEVYKKTEGFSQAEVGHTLYVGWVQMGFLFTEGSFRSQVRDLYAVFYKFAVPVVGSKLREAW